jgi:hypothetical protein
LASHVDRCCDCAEGAVGWERGRDNAGSQGATTVTSFTSDVSDVYFAAGGGVKKVPRAGGAMTPLPEPNLNAGSYIYGIALDARTRIGPRRT